ncbi:MAG: hypothetical protein IKG42_06510 [Clostridia bacterium]|nr:hypothetical protein [Clostridia bacterium]
MTKKVIILVISLFLIIALIPQVKAATFNVNPTLSKTEVKPGETFTVTLRLESEDGISGISLDYEYDTEKLERVNATLLDRKFGDMTELDENDEPTNTMDLILNGSSTVTSSDCYSIEFKVKSNATVGEKAKISFKNIEYGTDASSNSDGTIDLIEREVTIVPSSTPSPSTSPSPSPSTDETPGNDEKDPSAADKKFPSAGKMILSTIAIAGIIAAAIFGFLYRKYRDVK